MTPWSARGTVGNRFAARRVSVAVALLFMGAVAAQPAPAPKIQWSPSVVTHTIGNGTADDSLQATFASSEDLFDVTVFITPNLRPFI